ncbi:MAG: HD domain-containing protein [Thermoanaerobaculia bacterium]|nr:HD domain-containing protein [Thermoanaerobaculia bacterium]
MLATAVAFGLLSKVAEFFSESYGASFVFPPAGLSLAASVAFGGWGVLGVLAGAVATPWGAAAISPFAVVLFSLVHASAAVIPAAMLRRPTGPTDRRLLRVALYGVVLASLASGILGSLSLAWLGRLEWSVGALVNNLLAWWVADSMACLVLGLPLLLAFYPESLLDDYGRRIFIAWRNNTRQIALAGLALVTAVVVLWASYRLDWGFPAWMAVGLLAPVAIAGAHGGLGGAIWMNLPVCLSYFGLTVMPALSTYNGPSREILAPGYLVAGFFCLFGAVGGALSERNRQLLEHVQTQQSQLERDFQRTVVSLAAAIEAKDPTTVGHVQRVARLAERLGQELGLGGRDLQLLAYGALLHDVGKIGVPEAILNKQGPLDESETAVMHQHVEIGLKILGNIEVMREVLPLVKYHQERWDGKREGVAYPGYFGLRGENIPLGARILSVIDALDAITNDRPYRQAREMQEALAELDREAGAQFDPRVVAVLRELLEREPALLSQPQSASVFDSGALRIPSAAEIEERGRTAGSRAN